MQRPLEERVFKNEIFAIPKKIVKDVILHKHYRAFLIFIQLKRLYVSGVFMNDGGKIPYPMMAAYLGISISGLRGKIRQLKKYKLVSIDNKKNIHLASYQTFVNIFKPQFFRRMKKFTYKNVASADMLIKMAAIQDNFSKQEYIIKNKILSKEIFTVNAQKDRINSPKGNKPPLMKTDCPRTMHSTDLSKSSVRKIRKALLKDYNNLLYKYKRIYQEQLEVIHNGFPEINPTVTLSCAGIGRLFGIGASTGHYQRNKLAQAGILSIQSVDPLKVYPVSPQEQQELCREGVNVFSYNYPVKRYRGFEEKFFLHLPDKLTVNSFFIYENAKN